MIPQQFSERKKIDEYIRSLERLEAYTDQFDELWPSHADIPIYPDVIGKLRDGALRVLEGKVPGQPRELFGQAITVYDLGFTILLCDRQLGN